MCERAMEHFKSMKECLDENLQYTANVIERQRQRFLDHATREWEESHLRANQMENQQQRMKADEAEKHELDLHKLRVDVKDAIRANRIESEREKDHFHVYMEKLKARSMLKFDQLRYNYRVLEMQRSENVTVISERRRQLTKVQTEIAAIEEEIAQINREYMKDSKRTRAITASLDTANNQWQTTVEQQVLAKVKKVSICGS